MSLVIQSVKGGVSQFYPLREDDKTGKTLKIKLLRLGMVESSFTLLGLIII